MAKMRNLLAFDLGASNGRAILGQFDGEKITMTELHRFENNYIEMKNGVRLYISSTAPTGNIPDGSVGVGW